MNPVVGKDEKVHLELREELLERVHDVLPADAETAASVLIDLALSLLAKKFPANSTSIEKKLIFENYPFATEALIADRAMSAQGVEAALTLAHFAGLIAVDYCASSHVIREIADDAKAKDVHHTYGKELRTLFASSVAHGLSPFGAMCTMILIGVSEGKQRGLNTPKVARPLLDALIFAIKS